MTDLPYDPESKSWSIMTVSHGGTVSVIRDLTEREAAQMYERLDPWYGHTDIIYEVHPDFKTPGKFYQAMSCGSSRMVNDGDIETREVFGPPGWRGWTSEPPKLWPQHRTIYTDDEGRVLPADDPTQTKSGG